MEGMMQNLAPVLVAVVILLVCLVGIGFVMAKLYRRSSKEMSFVRTGFGGQKVIINGGALVFPVLHEVVPVNMNTLRLEVSRANEQALITKDRMRVDVQAEFYVRVKPTIEAIADAAQTLGRKTINPNMLKELVEGKFVDALRSVAAEMTMEELHEQRVEFVQRVQKAVSEDLLKNGLELESVSLTGLDQTRLEFLNPQNAFDAQGLTKLTEEIETRKQRRNEIEQDTAVAIRIKNLEAERHRLELQKEEEYAKLQQEREISVRRAAQVAEISREQAEKNREAKEAEILAKRQVDEAQIQAERTISEQRLEMERMLKEKEIEKSRSTQNAEIEKQKSIQLAEQVREIAIAEKSKEQSDAKRLADLARAGAVEAEEKVVTVREAAKAERQKQIDLIEAAKLAESSALSMTVEAQAEREAAVARAESLRTLALGEADKVRIAAQGEAEAELVKAEAQAKRYQVDAEGRKALHEADNTLSMAQIEMQIRLSVIANLKDIIRESVKPMEKIEGIRIVQMNGGLHGSPTGADTGIRGEGSLPEQVVNSALRYRVQAPLVDSLLKEVGLSGAELTELTQNLYPSS